MKKKVNKKSWLFILIFIVGLLVLLFPLISQLTYHRAAQLQVTEFDDAVSSMDNSEIEERLFLARAYNEALREKMDHGKKISFEDPFTEQDKQAGISEYARMLEVNEQIGYVDIPTIGEKLPVYAGTQESVLQKGAGHIEGTSLPVGGESTHSVITAHRGLPTARLFTDLDKVELGDEFYVSNLGETLAYEVDDIVVIEPREIEYLDISLGKDYVTLLTCTPYMVNSHRLLVRGHRVPYQEGSEEVDRQPNRLYIYLIGLGIVLLILLLMILIRRKRKKRTDL